MSGDHVPREEHAEKSRNDCGNYRRSSVRHVAPQGAALFLRSRPHVAPRIDFLLLDVRQPIDRGLIGVVGVLLEGSFLLDLRFLLIAHARRRRSMLRQGAWHLHQERGRAQRQQEQGKGGFFIAPDDW